MIHPDTIKLLRETDLGLQMGIYTFDQLLERIRDERMKEIVTESRNDHKKLKGQLDSLMRACGGSQREPGVMAKGMAWMESNMKMSVDDSDKTAADIITQGCDMGSKKLNKYLNRYSHADPAACDTSRKLIKIEDNLERALRPYL